MATQESEFELVIAGSGPAGLIAALFGARAGRKVLVVAGYNLGGQLMSTSKVENVAGFVDGIDGKEFMERMYQQAQRFGAEFLYEQVTAVAQPARGGRFTIRTDGGKEIVAGAVIVCSGASARKLGLPNEVQLTGHGVSYCATCDGRFFKDQIVYVIGGGDTALQDAVELSHLAQQVIVVHRSSRFSASNIAMKRACDEQKISFMPDTVVEEILDHGTTDVKAIRLKNLTTGQITEQPADGVFIAIGSIPNTGFVNDLLRLTKSGQVKVHDVVKTSKSGIFAAGDMANRYKLANVAIGDGTRAAQEALWYLEKKSVSRKSGAKTSSKTACLKVASCHQGCNNPLCCKREQGLLQPEKCSL